MLIERVELWLLGLPMTEPFAAAHGTSARRDIVVLRIETDEGSGWGECAALAEPTYSDEFAAGAFALIDEELGPRLVGHDLDAGTVAGRLSVVSGNPMTKAAIEMALLDVELRAAGHPLAHWLGAAADRVPAGAAVGLADPREVADRVADLAAAGFGRVKLKIAPGREQAVVETVRARNPAIEIQLDGNGAFGSEHLDLLAELGSSGVRAIEQPFPATRPDLAAELVARLARAGREGIPGPDDRGRPDPEPGRTVAAVVADEAATSLAAVGQLHQARALTAVSVKPSRLGGLQAARRLHDAGTGWGLILTAGGMVETSLGRHALAALAALPGFTLTGDVSPARSQRRADPWPDLDMVGGHIIVPTGPGIAPEPDLDLLERFMLRRSVVRS